MNVVRSKVSPWLALLVAGVALIAGSVSHAQSGRDIDEEFSVSPGGTLIVESDSGPIEVETWDQDTVRVRITGTDNFDVSVEQNGNTVHVVADSEGGFFFNRGGNIRFRIEVPRQFNVDLDTGGGSITVASITGNVTADTSGGRIEVGDVTDGDVEVDTSGGRIEIGNVQGGDVYADTSGGSIEIGNVSGDVEADTSGGSIRIGDVGGNMLADTSGGNIDVGRGGGRVALDTSGGTIRAAYAEGPIVVDTSGGNIYLGGSAVSVEADTSGGNIEIERSGGAVYADTSGGSITIRQSVGPIRADTAGGRIDAELVASANRSSGTVELESSGGDVTVRIPVNHAASIVADLESRRGRGRYQIYSDFPIEIREDDDGSVLGRGDINGGGDLIYLETRDSDIRIIGVAN